MIKAFIINLILCGIFFFYLIDQIAEETVNSGHIIIGFTGACLGAISQIIYNKMDRS